MKVVSGALTPGDDSDDGDDGDGGDGDDGDEGSIWCFNPGGV